MESKIKARNLIEKFNLIVLDTALGGSNTRVKKCALICVDEIIEILWHTCKNENEYRYWLEVKKEIEKL